MELKPGDVVILKSGGQPLTVAEVQEDEVSCIWIGEEGELFRETLPAAVLEVVHELNDDEEDEDDETDTDDEEDEAPVKDKVA